MKSSIPIRSRTLRGSKDVKFPTPIRVSKSNMVHLASAVFLLSSATFSLKLSLAIAVAWIAFSVYDYVFLPITKIDVDFRIKDDFVHSLEQELWP